VTNLARRKKSSSNNSFMFGSFDLGLENFNKRMTLSNNCFKGKMAEDSFALEQTIQGNDCKRIHKGGDYVVQNVIFSAEK
jgi:hypothetical protein